MQKVGWVALFLAVAYGALRAQTGSVADANGVYFEQKNFKPRLIHAVPADYPSDPRIAHIKHTCVFDAVVGADGSVQSARLENAHPSPFDENALRAIKGSTFAPAAINGHVVPVRTQVAVIFRGDGNPASPELERGPEFQYPKPTYWPPAEFSEEARRDRVSGVVLLTFIVTEDGKPLDIGVVSRLGDGLDEQAVKAVRRWRFKPATIDGEPVPTRLTTEVSFRFR